MKMLKTGDPCPCCGQPIKTKDKDSLRLLSWIRRNQRMPALAEIESILEKENTGYAE